MRQGLVLTLGIITLIDLGMLIFLGSSWTTKIILIPVIGSTSLICFIAGHWSEDANFKAGISLTTVIILMYLGIVFMLSASPADKTILFISLCFSYFVCFVFGSFNEACNKMMEKDLSDTDH